jgi:alpha-2-macroglobulin
VQAPFAPASGLLSLRRSGIVETIPFEMDEPTHVLQVAIEDEYIPNLHVAVDLAGSAPRTDDLGEPRPELPARPAYGTGQLELSIPPATRALSVTVTPEVDALQPGESTDLAIEVTDAAGAPVANAEMAVVVVDEAILALTDYQLQNPLDVFYQARGANVSSVYGRAGIVLASPDMLQIQMDGEQMARAAAPVPTAGMALGEVEADMAVPAMEMAEEMADMPAEAEAPAPEAPPDADDDSPIAIRTDFNPLAIFAPEVNTDASGRATVTVRVPDNLTRYRIMVVAVEGDNRFGAAEANITARLPLMVRPSAPRFLNFGDRFELPIVLQNQTDESMTVDLAVRPGNLNLVEGAGRRVTIPAHDRREVRFPAITEEAGTARMQIAAVAGSYTDAASVSLPVYTPATSEAFAVYGVIDEGAVVQPMVSPQNVWPQFGGLEVATSSTALQGLTDAVLYLVSYPFECTEQMASRILAVAALRDVLTAFEAEGLPAPEEIEAAVHADIERLSQLQNDDGGFPVWTRGRESWPFYSIHVAHALQRAAEKGFDVPVEMQDRVLSHIREIERYYPSWYSRTTRHALSSYAVYVRGLMGDVDTVKARGLLNEFPLEEQSLEAIAWLWQVLSNDPASTDEVEAVRRHMLNRAVETPSAANFVTSYGDDAYLMLHSNRRTDAIILDALIQDQPESDLIPKVVNGLMAHRSAGRWNNTQENVFVLLALDRYFNTFESVTPDFVANFWLGDVYAGGHEFEGYTTDTRQTHVPMRYLTESDEFGDIQDLVIAKEGDGRLYYRLGLRYAPTSLELDPLEMGFVVQRTYASVDDPDDVVLDEDGVWRIKAGARVEVTINMVVPSRRYHVALADPLPAGLEIINPALAVSESVPQDPNVASQHGWWWWGPWYEHQNLRDQRAEAFSTLVWEGVHEYRYVARATTPGEFVVPPAKAEEMYTPEVFGRSGTDRVIVE